jgi:hypothetical protein
VTGGLTGLSGINIRKPLCANGLENSNPCANAEHGRNANSEAVLVTHPPDRSGCQDHACEGKPWRCRGEDNRTALEPRTESGGGG